MEAIFGFIILGPSAVRSTSCLRRQMKADLLGSYSMRSILPMTTSPWRDDR